MGDGMSSWHMNYLFSENNKYTSHINSEVNTITGEK